MLPSLPCMYRMGLLVMCTCLSFTFAGPTLVNGEDALSLTFLGQIDLEDLKLNEPSGVAWGSTEHDKPRLWVVNDDAATVSVLKKKRDGDDQTIFKVVETYALSSELTKLEGVTMDSSGGAVLIQESTNRVIRLQSDSFEEIQRVELTQMGGYNRLQDYFANGSANKGLEGITWHATQGTFMVVKEGQPPMLIEVSADLQTILNYWVLGRDRGFTVPGFSQDTLDVSGIAYDAHRDAFWLVSDKGKSLFVYDYHQHRVTQRIPLGYRAGKGKGIGHYRRIQKAEGVAVSPDGAMLFIVSDKKDRGLYAYAIQK